MVRGSVGERHLVGRRDLMLTKKDLLDRIPRYSDGRLKGDEARRLDRFLNSYVLTQQELEMVAVEVQALVEHYGHEGPYMPGSRKYTRARL